MEKCWNLITQGGIGAMGGGMMLMGLFWIILLIAIVYLIVKLISNRPDNRTGKETSLEILQKEYAKGNITEEDYLTRKKHLE